MLALHFSCVAPKMTSGPDTTGGTSDTPPDHGGCGALVDPWPLDADEGFVGAMEALMPDLSLTDILADIALPRAGADCPTRVTSEYRDEVSGSCTTSTGDTWEGVAIAETVSSHEPMEVRRWTYEAFSYTMGDGSFSFHADGALSVMESEAPTVTEATGYWTRVVHDGSYGVPQGEVYRHQMVTELVDAPDASTFTWSSYVYVAWDPAGTTGDSCQSWDVVASDTCAVEPDGRVWFEVPDVVQLTFEGSELCDGCADVIYFEGDVYATVCGELAPWSR